MGMRLHPHGMRFTNKALEKLKKEENNDGKDLC